METEWSLADYAFRKIIRTFGEPTVDLFASILNRKCERYVSWLPDPSSEQVDAFTISWKGIFFYCFPPFSLLLRVMQKIIQDEAEGIVVAPYWPTQAWFPTFLRLKVGNHITFTPNHNLLTSPFRKSHPLHRKLTLVAAVLSGRRSGLGVSQNVHLTRF